MVAEALLVSWQDTPTRRAIVDFVERVTREDGPDSVLPAERVATFDNDGTLWSEKPIPIQLDFTLYRMAEQAEAEPSLRDQQPYKAAVERDLRWLGAAMIKHYKGDDSDLRLLMAASERAFQGMTVDDYAAEALGRLQTASHPTIVFGFANHGYVDGVNFHTDCARALVVSHLNRGNVHLPTSEVYLGVSKAHPRHVPFVVHRALSSA